MKLKLQTWLALTVILLAIPTAVRADVVTDWNAIAVQATLTANRTGLSNVIDIAIVHVAMYDAVQAIEKRYEPYYVDIPGASGSPVAKTSCARYRVGNTEQQEGTRNTGNV